MSIDHSLHRYIDNLKRICGFTPWHATARQRAEAFLRTVGKWKAADQAA